MSPGCYCAIVLLEIANMTSITSIVNDVTAFEKILGIFVSKIVQSENQLRSIPVTEIADP